MNEIIVEPFKFKGGHEYSNAPEELEDIHWLL